jgi:prepilin-type N-terminal cleavage/methylation domain-containing protein
LFIEEAEITGITKENNHGFTMIELIIVIVILGILGAIAVPRYLDLRANARRAARDGITGNLRAAASIAYANASVNRLGNINATSVYSSLAQTGGLTFGGTRFTCTIGGVAYRWTFTTPARIGSPSPTT